MRRRSAALWSCLALAVSPPAQGQTVTRGDGAGLAPLAGLVTGRVEAQSSGDLARQWPGTYAEAAFRGSAVSFRVGPGEVSLRVRVDGGAPIALVRPTPGIYTVGGLRSGDHRVRIDVASESQAGPTVFGGFLAGRGTTPLPLAHRTRAIEFVGDSHTVGYGNTATKRDCTGDEVWASTDTSRGLAALTAARYGADYQVNAISGRGVVRNYNGFAADTLPQAYPFALLDHAQPVRDPAWRPQLIVIALGTNDFSTPLHAGEKWSSREQLHADFEASYVAFVRNLESRHPGAHVILWATDMADGEIEAEVAKVADRLRAVGDPVGFVPVDHLAFSACHLHPSLADDERIAAALAGYIDAHPEIWGAAAASEGSGRVPR